MDYGGNGDGGRIPKVLKCRCRNETTRFSYLISHQIAALSLLDLYVYLHHRIHSTHAFGELRQLDSDYSEFLSFCAACFYYGFYQILFLVFSIL